MQDRRQSFWELLDPSLLMLFLGSHLSHPTETSFSVRNSAAVQLSEGGFGLCRCHSVRNETWKVWTVWVESRPATPCFFLTSSLTQAQPFSSPEITVWSLFLLHQGPEDWLGRRLHPFPWSFVWQLGPSHPLAPPCQSRPMALFPAPLQPHSQRVPRGFGWARSFSQPWPCSAPLTGQAAQ
jgi:hypothetical protein